MRNRFRAVALAGVLVLAGCAQNRAAAPTGGRATLGHGQAAPLAAQTTTPGPASSRYATPAPVSTITAARWVAIGEESTMVYAEPTYTNPIAPLRRGQAVQVLGRTDGDPRLAWCRVPWQGTPEAWIRCGYVGWIKGFSDTVPVIAPLVTATPSAQQARPVVAASPAPSVTFSNADVSRQLEQCRVTLYTQGLHAYGRGDGVYLIDGTAGYVPPDAPSDNALNILLTSNLKRCGFEVLVGGE